MENFDELLKKAKEGDPNAQCEVGIYFNRKGYFDESIEWHTKAAKKGYDNSIYLLGCTYMYDKKDIKKAIECFKTIAEKGDRHAQYKLGLLYLEEKNYKEAKNWFKKAAEQGHGMAKHELEQLKKEN